jgi:hypothetical protein
MGASPDSGKSGKISTYYAGMHMVLCSAPIDFIAFVQVKEKQVNDHPITLTGLGSGFGVEQFPIANGTSQVYLNKPEIFGGIKREGGVLGWLSVLFGQPDQPVAPYLASMLGSSCPAFRGVVSVVLNRMYLGTSYYLQTWRFFATRVTVRGRGIPQWQGQWSNPQIPINLTYSFAYTGAETLPENFGLTTDQVRTGYYVIRGYSVWVVVDDSKLSEMDGFRYMPITGSGGLINAVHVIRECLTDIEWGLGEDESTIDSVSFDYAAETCFTEGLGFSWLWEKDKPIEDFIAEVAEHINAVVYKSRQTGLWTITLIRKVEDTSTLPRLTSAQVQKITKLSRRQLHELTSQFVLKYESNLTYKEATVRISDPSLAARQGKEVLKSRTFSGVASPEVAWIIANRELKALSTPILTGSLVGGRSLAELNPGDAFVLEKFGSLTYDLVLRVVSIDIGTVEKEAVTIDFTEDTFEVTRGILTAQEGSKWSPPSSSAEPVSYRKVFESPYYVQALEKGDSAAQAISPDLSFLRATAVSPTGLSVSSQLWCAGEAPGSVFQYRSQIDFQASGVLLEAIDRQATTLSVGSLMDEANLIPSTFLYLGEEIVFVTATDLFPSDPTNLTFVPTIEVKRGVLDTIPEAHSLGSRFIQVQSVNSSDPTTYGVGETVSAKLLTETPSSTLDIASAPVDYLELIGRMHRPYPPGNLKINGEYWLSEIDFTNPVEFSWASRNRFSQTTSDILSYYAESTSSEDGVTYNLTLYLDTGSSIIYAFTGGDLSVTVAFSEIGGRLTEPTPVRLELTSENLNGLSFQTVVHYFDLLPPTLTTFVDSDGTIFIDNDSTPFGD